MKNIPLSITRVVTCCAIVAMMSLSMHAVALAAADADVWMSTETVGFQYQVTIERSDSKSQRST